MRLRKLPEKGQLVTQTCEHFKLAQAVTPSADGCEECLELGDTWVHLRLCLVCGHVGCCDDSKNKHATRHFHTTQHPVIKSFEPGEDWGWCYLDQLYVESVPENQGDHRRLSKAE